MLNRIQIVNAAAIATASVLVFALAGSPAAAAVVDLTGSVANNSFDNDGTITVATPSGWTSVNTNLGTRGTTGGLTPTDGTHQLWLNGGNTIYQDTGVIIQLGATYELTVDVGVTAPFDNQTATLRLYGSTLGFGTALAGAENSLVTSQSVWELGETVSFTATATEAGQTLGIALVTPAGQTQTEWDYVRLSTTPFVPAPAALPAGLAMLGLVAVRRRRMK